MYNEIISKIVLKDDDGEHKVSNVDSALETSCLYSTNILAQCIYALWTLLSLT